MADEHDQTDQEEPIPLGQVIFDEWFLLFLASIVLSFLLYNAWGLLELLSTPLSR